MKRNHRGKLLGASGVLAVFLAMSSVAYACTIFRGDMTATISGVSQTVTGANRVDDKLGMDWCGGTPTWELTASAGTAASVTISTAAAADCKSPLTNTNQLRDGTYTVASQSGEFKSGSVDPSVHNCHGATNTVIGNYVVSGGAGASPDPAASRTYDYTQATKPKPGWTSICVYGLGFPDANLVNIESV